MPAKSLIIHTGNILSLNDIKAKPGQNASEELVESIKLTLKDAAENDLKQAKEIRRNGDNLLEVLSENDRKNLKIGAKLFLDHDDIKAIKEAIISVFNALETKTIDNIVIGFNEKKFKLRNHHAPNILDSYKKIWKVLEHFNQENEDTYYIGQLGVADLDEDKFRQLYDWSQVKPSIFQINLSVCCVVPPTLQEFCNDNHIQLLTHSDCTDILPSEKMNMVFDEEFAKFNKLIWIIRYQIHIKCRGILISKGYILNFAQDLKNNFIGDTNNIST